MVEHFVKARSLCLRPCRSAPPIFGPDVLPLIIPPLHTFLPPFATPHGLFTTPSDTRETLISADMESLEESCALLEILCLDVEDVRLALARSLMFTEEHGVECLSEMLTFVRGADYPPWWNEDPDKQQYERSLDNCKAGVIKGIVEVAGEEKNTDVLWDESEDDKPGGEFVSSMVEWIKTSNVAEREDLIICATLSIANLIRRGTSQSVQMTTDSPAGNIRGPLTSHCEATDFPSKTSGTLARQRRRSQSETRCYRFTEEPCTIRWE